MGQKVIRMNKPLILTVLLVLMFVCVTILVDFWIKLYDLTMIPVTALTIAQGFQILSLALSIGVVTMLVLAFLFLVLELSLKRDA